MTGLARIWSWFVCGGIKAKPVNLFLVMSLIQSSLSGVWRCDLVSDTKDWGSKL